ncbi:MAG: transporter [Hyphomicrobium sp.]
MSGLSRSLAAASAAIALSSMPTSAFAHHPGGPGNTGGTGPINTISATTLPAGMSVAAIVYDRIGLDPLSDQTLIHEAEHAAEHGDDHAHVHSLDTISSPSINYAYGLTSDLMIAARLPYVQRTDIREGHVHEDDGEGEVHLRGDAAGIGDLSALAQWRFFNNQTSGTEAAVLIGFKAPTGKTSETDSDGERFDAEFQPGSGSWDGMFGMALTQRSGQWSFDASLLYTVVGEGTQDTDLGDRVHYSAAVSYRLTSFNGANGPMFHGAKPHHAGDTGHGTLHSESAGPALDLIVELNGEWHDKQEAAGEADDNSGGHTLYIAPGLRLSQDKWSAFASLGIPVANTLNGIQAEPDWRLVTGVSLGF